MHLRAMPIEAKVVLALMLAGASERSLHAQTAQIPSTFPQQPYAAPSLAPSYSAPIGPPPTFDAYASPSVSGTVGAPPASVPYTYGAGPATNTFPPQLGVPAGPWQPYAAAPGGYAPAAPTTQGLFSDGLPFDWQQGTYGYQAADGSLVRFQKFLQRIGIEHTWLAGDGGSQDFELNRTELAATFAIPVMHNVDTPLLVTPGFAFNFLEGPVGGPDPMMVEPRGPASTGSSSVW